MSELLGLRHPGKRDLYILYSVQAGFGAQQVPYSVHVEGSCLDSTVTSARSSSVIPASDELRNDWHCTSFSSYVFMMYRRTNIFYS